ncbi:histidine phosphatase family protein [candidate division WWE3 bacterium]|nr:histidine phosphatase family protein [candidate division WWE3 bacterium]
MNTAIPIDKSVLYEKYGKEKVDRIVAHLNYKAESKPLPKEENSDFPILYVFRHGQTTDNLDMVFSGWRDPDLTSLGILEAQELAEKLKTKKIHMLIASDQKRAIHTMQIAISKNPYAKGLEIHQDKRLRERNYGDLNGKSKLEISLENEALAQKYRRSWDFPPPGGESLKMVVERVNLFLGEIIPLMKTNRVNVAVSCHGNSIRGIRKYFENLTEEETVHIETPLGKDYTAYTIR